jgi:hypothetical protein
MTNAPNHAAPPQHPHTSVVLLAPELFPTPPDQPALHTTFTHPHRPTRLLVRLAAPTDLALAEALAHAGVAVELLVPAGMVLPPTPLPLARMPPGSTESDTDELALALSDALLADANPPDLPLVRLAHQLTKPLLTPGKQPAVPPGSRRSMTHHLDPEQSGWHRALRRYWGRWEQFYLELFAFNWKGRQHGGIATSSRRLRGCLFSRKWEHTPYFAPETPESWKDLAPDRAAIDPTTPIVATFDRLDRSALHGAYIQRDLAWATHLVAAFAVLFAVAGSIGLFPALPDWVWPVGELLALFIVVVATVFSRSVALQDRWTACRFGAEQLRIARMCLPLLVVPSALCSVDEAPKGDDSLRALAEVKRAVRDQGIPRLSPTPSPIDAAKWVELVVTDQRTYHRNNHRKLHCAEQRLNGLTIILFVMAFIAVCWHLASWYLAMGDNKYLLLVTAAGPAFAAAVHGIATRLGFVHRIQLSQDAERELSPILDELGKVIANPSAPEPTWITVRKLAFRAAEAMGRETRSWHSQVRRQKDEF